jgi:hypothetical protein
VAFSFSEAAAEIVPECCPLDHSFAENRQQSFSLEQIGSASALMLGSGGKLTSPQFFDSQSDHSSRFAD